VIAAEVLGAILIASIKPAPPVRAALGAEAVDRDRDFWETAQSQRCRWTPSLRASSVVHALTVVLFAVGIPLVPDENIDPVLPVRAQVSIICRRGVFLVIFFRQTTALVLVLALLLGHAVVSVRFVSQFLPR
jgi:hypothetical protein